MNAQAGAAQTVYTLFERISFDGGGRIYYRRRVPEGLRAIVGKREIWRSLGTDSRTVALRRSHVVATLIERDFEKARSLAGLPVDQAIISAFAENDQAT